MYKLMIVEDEHLIRKWLMYGMDYGELQLVVVGEASNGEEGRKKIKDLQPDIVITDINMPIKNAFDMFKETKNIQYKKIILSGYNDFPNAKQAIHYGVKEFIVKPLDEEELKKSLLRLTRELDLEKSQQSNKLNIDDYPFLTEIKSSTDLVVQEIIQWIKDNYQKHFIISELARHLGYSESYIYKKIKTHLGITLNEYITRYRIKMAIFHIMEEPQLKIYEIAPDVGFSDYKYFNKVFKKYLGMTISEFKNQLK